MNLRHTMLAAVIVALAGAAHAHECSGGTDGGMDATGNDCSEARALIIAAPAATAPAATPAAKRADSPAVRPVARASKSPAPAASQHVALKTH